MTTISSVPRPAPPVAPVPEKVINLLDPRVKREWRAARANVVIVRYCLIVVVALLCVGLLALFSHWWLMNATTEANHEKAENATLRSGYQSVLDERDAFVNDLGKIQLVLTNRSQYSTALLNIAASLPTGAYIKDISLTPSLLDTPLAIEATTSDSTTALALKDRLSRSPIYSKVELVSTSCSATDGVSSCAVEITATLQKAVFTAGVL